MRPQRVKGENEENRNRRNAQKTKRQIESGKERTAKQQSVQSSAKQAQLLSQHPPHLPNKVCTSAFVLEHSILKRDHATGREAAVARVPC